MCSSRIRIMVLQKIKSFRNVVALPIELVRNIVCAYSCTANRLVRTKLSSIFFLYLFRLQQALRTFLRSALTPSSPTPNTNQRLPQPGLPEPLPAAGQQPAPARRRGRTAPPLPHLIGQPSLCLQPCPSSCSPFDRGRDCIAEGRPSGKESRLPFGPQTGPHGQTV
jgi:hypothetical protein